MMMIKTKIMFYLMMMMMKLKMVAIDKKMAVKMITNVWKLMIRTVLIKMKKKIG